MARFWFVLLLTILVVTTASAQNQPTNDPQALSLAAQSVAAMAGGTTIADVTLTGTATWTAGSDVETGTFTLRGKGNSESRVDLALTGGTRIEIRNNTATPQGESIAADGSIAVYAVHNCWTDAVWFYPALSSLNVGGSPSAVLTYVGLESRGGVSVEHLRAYYFLANAKTSAVALAQQASTIEYYLDASSFLPLSITLNSHPDDDAGTNIPTEIDFLAYQQINGIQVPGRIQKFLQGSLELDLVVTTSSFNTGLSDSIFAIQ